MVVTRGGTERIPLFPLGTVLFPGVVLPLHIFEPRYRALIRRLMEPDSPREFGVVGIRQGWEVGTDGVTALYDIGCTAELRQVTPDADGRYDIVAIGRRRFQLHDVDSTSEPYFTGLVEPLPESSGDSHEAAVLARAVGELFARCRRVLQVYTADTPGSPDGAGEPQIGLPADPQLLAHVVASTAPLAMEDRQALLAINDVTERLRLELTLLKREATMLSRLRAVPVSLAGLRVPQGPN